MFHRISFLLVISVATVLFEPTSIAANELNAKIDGAFGIKLGDTVSADSLGDANLRMLGMQFFRPEPPNKNFSTYTYRYSPTTLKIYEVRAEGLVGSLAAAYQIMESMADIIEKKYSATRAGAFSEGAFRSRRFEQGDREISVAVGGEEHAFIRVTYSDMPLFRLAKEEWAEINKKATDARGLE